MRAAFLDDPVAKKIMNVKKPYGLFIFENKEACDFGFVHDRQGACGKIMRCDGFGGLCHDVGSIFFQNIVFHIAPEIAIGDDSDKRAACVLNADAAKAFLGHVYEDIRHKTLLRAERDLRACMHDIGDRLQARAQRAAGMEIFEMFGGEAALFKKCYSKRVSESHLQNDGACGGKPDGACLLHFGKKKGDVGMLGEGAAPP